MLGLKLRPADEEDSELYDHYNWESTRFGILSQDHKNLQSLVGWLQSNLWTGEGGSYIGRKRAELVLLKLAMLATDVKMMQKYQQDPSTLPSALRKSKLLAMSGPAPPGGVPVRDPADYLLVWCRVLWVILCDVLDRDRSQNLPQTAGTGSQLSEPQNTSQTWDLPALSRSPSPPANPLAAIHPDVQASLQELQEGRQAVDDIMRRQNELNYSLQQEKQELLAKKRTGQLAIEAETIRHAQKQRMKGRDQRRAQTSARTSEPTTSSTGNDVHNLSLQSLRQDDGGLLPPAEENARQQTQSIPRDVTDSRDLSTIAQPIQGDSSNGDWAEDDWTDVHEFLDQDPVADEPVSAWVRPAPAKPRPRPRPILKALPAAAITPSPLSTAPRSSPTLVDSLAPSLDSTPEHKSPSSAGEHNDDEESDGDALPSPSKAKGRNISTGRSTRQRKKIVTASTGKSPLHQVHPPPNEPRKSERVEALRTAGKVKSWAPVTRKGPAKAAAVMAGGSKRSQKAEGRQARTPKPSTKRRTDSSKTAESSREAERTGRAPPKTRTGKSKAGEKPKVYVELTSTPKRKRN